MPHATSERVGSTSGTTGLGDTCPHESHVCLPKLVRSVCPQDTLSWRFGLAPLSIGVYIGCVWHEYQALHGMQQSTLDVASLTGNGLSFLAGRISYTFDFGGPSIGIDTACSSSLVAAHFGHCALLALEVNESGKTFLMVTMSCCQDEDADMVLCLQQLLGRILCLWRAQAKILHSFVLYQAMVVVKCLIRLQTVMEGEKQSSALLPAPLVLIAAS